MGKRDRLHQAFLNALRQAGWIVTNDPLSLRFGGRDLFVDVAAHKEDADGNLRECAFEVKTFGGQSVMYDLEVAIGQCVLYRHVAKVREVNRTIYLAMSQDSFTEVFCDDETAGILADLKLKVVTFDPIEEVLLRWIE